MPFFTLPHLVAVLNIAYLMGKSQQTVVQRFLPTPLGTALGIVAARPKWFILAPLRLTGRVVGWTFGWGPRTPDNLKNTLPFEIFNDETFTTLVLRKDVAQITGLVVVSSITIVGTYIVYRVVVFLLIRAIHSASELQHEFRFKLGKYSSERQSLKNEMSKQLLGKKRP